MLEEYAEKGIICRMELYGVDKNRQRKRWHVEYEGK